jgi:hypothetical protein
MADQTTQELIKAAYRKIGVVAVGETPSDDEMQDALLMLKVIFRNWAAKVGPIYVTTTDTHTLTSGTTSYTIGSGATINTARPSMIKAAYATENGLDYDLDIIDEKTYLKIADKDIGYNYPSKLWYQPTYPNGTIYLWPPGGGTLTIHSYKQLSEPSALTTSIQFPGEYDAAIIWNLAEQMSPEYGMEPTPYIMNMAQETLDDVINFNAALDIPQVSVEILQDSRRYHVDEG